MLHDRYQRHYRHCCDRWPGKRAHSHCRVTSMISYSVSQDKNFFTCCALSVRVGRADDDSTAPFNQAWGTR